MAHDLFLVESLTLNVKQLRHVVGRQLCAIECLLSFKPEFIIRLIVHGRMLGDVDDGCGLTSSTGRLVVGKTVALSESHRRVGISPDQATPGPHANEEAIKLIRHGSGWLERIPEP